MEFKILLMIAILAFLVGLFSLDLGFYFVKINKNTRGPVSEGEYFSRMKCQNPPSHQILREKSIRKKDP